MGRSRSGKNKRKRHTKSGRPLKKKTPLNGGRKKINIFDPLVKCRQKQCTEGQKNLLLHAIMISSVSQYKALVSDCVQRNARLYPNYTKIDAAKKNCLVQIQHSSDKEVFVSLQNILNKTTERLCDSVTQEWDERSLFNLELVVSIGFDSSSGHVSPHQKSADDTEEKIGTQTSLFVTCFNLLEISCKLKNFENHWINPTPQSIRFTRPLRMSVEKEDCENIRKEMKRLDKEINKLNGYKFILPNKKVVRVKYEIYKTMFDGKCVNSLIENPAASRCPMCLKTAHQFGNSSIDFTPKESSLSFGLTCRRLKEAHSHDRITELLLDINNTYNLSNDKIIGTVTDNGSNFVKAFGVSSTPCEVMDADDDRDAGSDSDEDDDEDIMDVADERTDSNDDDSDCSDIEQTVLETVTIPYEYHYLAIMEHLALAIDKLQGDEHCHYGQLIPSLITIEQRWLQKIPKMTSKSYKDFIHGMTGSLKKRFSDIFAIVGVGKIAAVATLSHPNFKKSWTIVKNDIKWPNGITIDLVSKRIYWIDAKLNTIASCDYNGQLRRTVLFSKITIQHPFSITTFEDYVYWTDWKQDRVYKANKLNGEELEIIISSKHTHHPFVVQVYHPYKQPDGLNICEAVKGHCSHFCLPLPRNMKNNSNQLFNCACPDGFKLSNDKLTCTVEIDKIPFGNKTVILGGDFRQTSPVIKYG
ncbi:hypothetical protein TKK_0015397 [Trichogramma kaykai]